MHILIRQFDWLLSIYLLCMPSIRVSLESLQHQQKQSVPLQYTGEEETVLLLMQRIEDFCKSLYRCQERTLASLLGHNDFYYHYWTP